MYFALSEFTDHGAMQDSAVSFMEVKTILRILFVEPRHDAIARDFRDNRRRGNHRDFFIAFDNRLLRDSPGKKKPAIKKYVRMTVPGKPPMHKPDSAKPGPCNIDAIYCCGRDAAGRPCDTRMRGQTQKPFFPFFRA